MIRIFGQEQSHSLGSIRDVHAGVGTDETMACTGYDHAAFHFYYAGGFAQYELDHARILLEFCGPFLRPLRWLNGIEWHDSAFGFGNNFLRND